MDEQQVTITLQEYKGLLEDAAAINAVHRLVMGASYYAADDILRILGIEKLRKEAVD